MRELIYMDRLINTYHRQARLAKGFLSYRLESYGNCEEVLFQLAGVTLNQP